jgi:hypothetical protein
MSPPPADHPPPAGGGNKPSLGFIFGALLAAYLASFVIDALGMSIARNTRVLLMVAVAAALFMASKTNK